MLTTPVISLSVMKKLFPSYEPEAESLARNGLWYYSVESERFLSYVPNVNVSVDDVEPVRLHLGSEAVFTIRKLSSVYEITVKEGFPSSLLLSENLQEIVEQYLDVTPNLHVVVLDSVTAPIIMGSKTALERLVFPAPEGTYVLKPLLEFVQEGGS